jgi:hypothetical protein
MRSPDQDDPETKERHGAHLAEHILPDAVPGHRRADGLLHQWLPGSTLEILVARHFTWEDAVGEYAALVANRCAQEGS